MDRNTDILRQGFMKPLRSQAQSARRVSDAEWKRALGKAAQARYASYGPSFFADDAA